MSTKQLDRLKSQLLQSGAQQKDNPLWQVINQLIDILRQTNIDVAEVAASSGGGGSGDAITELTTDVVAVGPGAVPATIQPLAVTTGKIDNLAVTAAKLAADAVTTIKILDANVTTAKIANNAVTLAKLQQATQTSVLLGNGNISAPIDYQEIGLGENLEIESGLLQVFTDDGEGGHSVGLAHKMLSPTHSDSLPADAVLGDLIKADDGGDLPGTFAGFYLRSGCVEDFEGIRFAYMRGFNGHELASGNVMWGAPPPLEFTDETEVDTQLTPNIWDFFLQTGIIEDFEGIRFGIFGGVTPGGFAYISGKNMAYMASLLAMVPMPDLANPSYGVRWQRLAVGIEGQVLQPIDGVPAWTSDLELAGDADIDGDVTSLGTVTGANVAATGQVTAGTNVIALGNIQAPTILGRPLGSWQDVTFAAGNFTANGGTTPTWTLTSPDQVLFRYCYIGTNLMKVQVYLATTSVASVAGNVVELRIKIPDSKSASGQCAHLVGAQENGAAVFDVYASTDPAVDATLIFVRTFPIGGGRAFNQTPNATYIAFTIDIRTA